MLSKLNSRFLATSVSVAALTIGMAFSQQVTQKAAAQTATDDAAQTATDADAQTAPDAAAQTDAAVQAFRNGETDFVIINTSVDLQDGEVQIPIANSVNVLARSQYDSVDKSNAIKSLLTQILNNDDQIRSLGYEPLADKSGSLFIINSIQP
ncbi:MAG: hypothetical protein DSM106950_10875 [Stigonema ocellatum SAG 48.90 = DSM 106950]|nr:hypothetical protein [Stigonema ocellatum SAG 48.90 = DSM 106950]